MAPAKSILVLSGGLDSTVSSWIACQKTTPLLALTFDYGQRAAKQEIRSARSLAGKLGVAHRLISLPWLQSLTHTALVDRAQDLPVLDPTDLDKFDAGLDSAQRVWVPNRNGVFLNVAASFAESLGAEWIVTGFNAEEGATFPDNSVAFVQAADAFFSYSTLTHAKVVSYTLSMDKLAIVRKGQKLGIPFEDLWFCYEGGERSCGRCESCLRAHRAFQQAGLTQLKGHL